LVSSSSATVQRGTLNNNGTFTSNGNLSNTTENNIHVENGVLLR
jgi:hypothetical protein